MDIILRRSYIRARELDFVDGFFKNIFNISASRYNVNRKIRLDYINYLSKIYTKIIYFILAFEEYRQSRGISTDYYVKNVLASRI